MNPVIGISTNYLTVERGKFIGMERIYVNKDYADAIISAGGIPLLLPPVEESGITEHYIRLCDGFILSGGGDINPLLYNEMPHPKLEEFHTSLDRAQWLLTQKILKSGKPLLAICRGIQLLNVVLGGTLWQDISAMGQPTMLHSQSSPRGDVFHTVSIKPGSILYELFGSEIKVNSFHHQCLNQSGSQLEITAVAPDGITEAVEMRGHRFAVGVQWHPEMLLRTSDKMLPLFQKLIASCLSQNS